MSVTLKTSLGDLKIELEVGLAPKNTANFLALCGTDYYNGTIFHRNVAGYMVQGGDPTGKGKGGHSIYGEEEPVEDEFSPHLKHDRRGVVSMINNGPNTNRSQFFITYARAPELDGKYTAIGRVIHGWETLDAMEQVPVKGKRCRPTTPIVVESATIHANPIAQGAAQ